MALLYVQPAVTHLEETKLRQQDRQLVVEAAEDTL